MPTRQAGSSKTMNAKTGKSAGPSRNAKKPAGTVKPGERGLREAHPVVGRGAKSRSQRSEEETPILASKVTARSQTTLPSGVRKALGLRAGDRIAYLIEKDQVVIRKVTAEEEDPALDGFLELLGEDIARNKDRVVFATKGFARYLDELTAGIEVDYDAPIEGDFQL